MRRSATVAEMGLLLGMAGKHDEAAFMGAQFPDENIAADNDAA